MAYLISLYPLRERVNIDLEFWDKSKLEFLNTSLKQSSKVTHCKYKSSHWLLFHFFDKNGRCSVLHSRHGISPSQFADYESLSGFFEERRKEDEDSAKALLSRSLKKPHGDWIDRESTQHLLILDTSEWNERVESMLIKSHLRKQDRALRSFQWEIKEASLSCFFDPKTPVIVVDSRVQKEDTGESCWTESTWQSIYSIAEVMTLHKAYHLWIRRAMDQLFVHVAHFESAISEQSISELMEFRSEALMFQMRYYFRNPIKRNYLMLYDFSKWLHQHFDHDDYNTEFLRQMQALLQSMEVVEKRRQHERDKKEREEREIEKARNLEREKREQAELAQKQQALTMRISLVGFCLAFLGFTSVFGTKYEDVSKWATGWVQNWVLGLSLLLGFGIVVSGALAFVLKPWRGR
jgi:hypothetical protein